MCRRQVLETALCAAVLLLTGQGYRLTASPQDEHEAGHFKKCAKLCADCVLACETNYQHCTALVIKGQKEHAKAMQLSLDCAEVCTTSARLSARMSPLALISAEASAKACDLCATECEKFKTHQVMFDCAQACRQCAAECRKMVKHLGEEHK
jgi:hypothetical protein